MCFKIRGWCLWALLALSFIWPIVLLVFSDGHKGSPADLTGTQTWLLGIGLGLCQVVVVGFLVVVVNAATMQWPRRRDYD